MNKYNVEKIREIGNEWIKGEHHRIYINNYSDLIGLSVNHYGTGNISSASLNGEKISNTRAKKLLGGTVFYDIKTDRIVGQYISDDAMELIKAALEV